jgi:hypothetical protein
MPESLLPTPTRTRRTLSVTGHRFALLFLFLLGYLVYYPYAADGSGFRYHIFRVLGSSVTLLTVYAISFRRGLVFIALILAVPALLQRTVLFRADASMLSRLAIFFGFAFDVFVIVVIFRRVFSRETPDAESIFGALCIYLMVGFSFASLYTVVASLQPNAFYLDPLTNSHKFPKAFDFVYYSFGTMTSLGAAGMTAVSPQVRSLAVIESILGILYLAVLISRLMGAYRGNYASRQNQDGRTGGKE